jgi:short-subunit dehydrogenase
MSTLSDTPEIEATAVQDMRVAPGPVMISAVVLGGTAGVGRAVVDALLADGHRVGVIARGQARLDQMSAELGERIATASADVGDHAALEAAVASILPEGAAVRVWVNCAMATSFSPFDKMLPEEFDKIIRTTLVGQVNGTRIALKHMVRGNIVNIGSGLSYRPVPLQSAYCAAKHAINGFTGSVRSELIADKRPIALSLIQLPAMDTPQFTWALNRLAMKPQPAPPIYSPNVAAEAVMQAIRTDAREMLVGKSVIMLVLGNMVLPGYIDRRMAASGVKSQKSDKPEPGGRPDNLFAPVEHPATATGAFGGRAEPTARMIDGDLARKIVFFGSPALTFVLGLLLG